MYIKNRNKLIFINNLCVLPCLCSQLFIAIKSATFSIFLSQSRQILEAYLPNREPPKRITKGLVVHFIWGGRYDRLNGLPVSLMLTFWLGIMPAEASCKVIICTNYPYAELIFIGDSLFGKSGTKSCHYSLKYSSP